MSLSNTTVNVAEDQTNVTEVVNLYPAQIATIQIITNIVPRVRRLELDFVLPSLISSEYTFTPYKDIGSSNIQGAIYEFAQEVGVKKQNQEPSSYVEGDLWYDLDDNQLKVAREQSGSVSFVPLLEGGDNMDSIEGGSFV